MKALTPGDLTQTARSLRLSRLAVPTFRPQPRDPPNGRFECQSPQRQRLLPGFAMNEQARHQTPPKQVRHPTDCRFTSSCSPPRLAATQLPSITGFATNPGTDLHRADKASSRTHSSPGVTRGSPQTAGSAGIPGSRPWMTLKQPGRWESQRHRPLILCAGGSCLYHA
jgi:hypothetical protein